MIPLIGTSLYGKVDNVPGLFYVATTFVHLKFIPLFPLASYVVLAGSVKGEIFQGYPIQLSKKSVLFAWLRWILAVCGTFGCVMLGICLLMLLEDKRAANNPDNQVMYLVLAFISIFSFVSLYLSFRFTKAKPLRALELAGKAGISPEQLAGYFVNSPAQDLQKIPKGSN